MNLKNRVLRERSQIQKPKYCMISFILSILDRQNCVRNQITSYLKWELTENGYMGTFLKLQKYLMTGLKLCLHNNKFSDIQQTVPLKWLNL